MPAVAIVPTSTPAAGVTLRQYRRPLADQLGLYDPDLTVISQASFEPRRNVIVDRLRDDDAARDRWAGGYLFARTSAAGTQAKILGQGYHGQLGALALADPPTTAFPDGTGLELSWPLPIRRHGGIKGINDLVNEALARTRILARIVMVGDGTRDHSLAAYPFVTSDTDIRAVYDTLVYGPTQPLERSRSRGRIERNGATTTFISDVAYGTGETWHLEVYVPGDRLVNDGSGWLYPTTPGLQNDDYQAAAPQHWVTTIGMVKGLQQLRKMLMADRTIERLERNARLLEIKDQMKAWAPAAYKIVRNEIARPVPAEADAVFGVVPGVLASEWT